MRDPRAGARLPTLQLPDRWARCGSRWANLLLRSLRAYGRQDPVKRPRLSLTLKVPGVVACLSLVTGQLLLMPGEKDVSRVPDPSRLERSARYKE